MYKCTVIEMYKLICLGDTGDKEDMRQIQIRFDFNNIYIYVFYITLPKQLYPCTMVNILYMWIVPIMQKGMYHGRNKYTLLCLGGREGKGNAR